MANKSELIFSIPGPPVAKGRPRFSGRGKFVHAYTPKKTKEYQSLVAEEFKNISMNEPYEGPVELFLYFHLKKPKTGKIPEYHTKKTGDVDNFAKSVMDALNGVAYKDDAQVFALYATKQYSDEPRCDAVMVLH